MGGVPTIEIVHPDESSIGHELLHLKLENVDGVPKLQSIPGCPWPEIFDPQLLARRSDTMALVTSAYEHKQFFPEMKAMGLDPIGEEREFVQQAIQANSNFTNLPFPEPIATYYVEVAEFMPELVGPFSKYLQNQGLRSQVDLGTS